MSPTPLLLFSHWAAWKQRAQETRCFEDLLKEYIAQENNQQRTSKMQTRELYQRHWCSRKTLIYSVIKNIVQKSHRTKVQKWWTVGTLRKKRSLFCHKPVPLTQDRDQGMRRMTRGCSNPSHPQATTHCLTKNLKTTTTFYTLKAYGSSFSVSVVFDLPACKWERRQLYLSARSFVHAMNGLQFAGLLTAACLPMPSKLKKFSATYWRRADNANQDSCAGWKK